MADSNLDVAVHIKTHLQRALQDFGRLEKGLGGTGRAADRAGRRMRRIAGGRFIPARAGNTARCSSYIAPWDSG